MIPEEQLNLSIYPCLKTLGISYTIYCKGTKLASKVELLNIFNLNNEDSLSQILIFDFSIIFDLFSLIIHFLGEKKNVHSKPCL